MPDLQATSPQQGEAGGLALFDGLRGERVRVAGSGRVDEAQQAFAAFGHAAGAAVLRAHVHRGFERQAPVLEDVGDNVLTSHERLVIEAEGITTKAYAEREGLSPQALYQWRKRLVAGGRRSRAKLGGFVPVQIEPSMTARAGCTVVIDAQLRRR